ncbi:MAG: FAD-dependent oxidoreductase [Deltaproteobacteria bacterium]|nr:FAD-dependent oxidoreductase [Deltaproteobacteria bacterium]
MSELLRDVAVIGCGPAGVQAAIHAASKKASVIVFGKARNSSLYKAHVANYCCYEQPITGKALLECGRSQAESFGAEFLEEDLIETKCENDVFTVVAESGQVFTSRTLILSMGVSRKKLGVKGEERLTGRGVSYCVDCDANFFKGLEVAVVGNESAAASGALTLLSYAKTVYLICRKLKVTDALSKKIKNSELTVLEGERVKEIIGEDLVEGVLLKSGETLKVDGIFVERGAKGAIELAANLGVMFDPETIDAVETNKKQETNIPGLYAAGDIAGLPWQIAKAVGEGCVAGMAAADYAKRLAES